MEELTPGQIRYRRYRETYLKYRKKYKNKPASRDKALFGGNREKAIQRDGEKCVRCGMTREEHKIKYGFDINVDHINGKGRNTPKNEKDNRLENLQTLCCACHCAKHSTSSNHLHRLTIEEVREIREQYASGMVYQKVLAKKYQVSLMHISNIVNRNRWKKLI